MSQISNYEDVERGCLYKPTKGGIGNIYVLCPITDTYHLQWKDQHIRISFNGRFASWSVPGTIVSRKVKPVKLFHLGEHDWLLMGKSIKDKALYDLSF